jgi:ribokinase
LFTQNLDHGKTAVSIDVNSSTRLSHFGIPKFRQLLAVLRPDLLLMNADEAAMLDPFSALAPIVVVHRGKSSTLVYSRGTLREVWEGIDPGLEVVDPTGAGDAFAAGILKCLSESPGDLEAAIIQGHLIAQHAILMAGSEPPFGAMQ